MQISFDISPIMTGLGTGGVIAIVILFMAFNWQNIASFVTDISNVPLMLLKTGQKGALRRSVQSEINKVVVDLDREAPGLFNNSVKVEWLDDGNDHATIKNGSIFIRVRETTDQDLIFVNSIMSLLDRALLSDARQYLHRNILKGIKLVLAGKFTNNSRFKLSQAVFREKYYDPELENDRKFAETVNQLEFLDYQGLFTRVYLRECAVVPKYLGLSHDARGPKWDLINFLKYVVNFLEGIEQKTTDFEYSNATIKVAFAVLADPVKYYSVGRGFYIKRTVASIKRGARTVYIIALGDRNARAAVELANELHFRGAISTFNSFTYNISRWGEALKATCVVCPTVPDVELISAAEQDQNLLIDDDGLKEILLEKIPEMRSGTVQIVKSIWIKKTQAIVIVHSEKNTNPVGACIGKGASRVKEIESALKSHVRFVKWSTDAKEIIKSSLNEIRNYKIVNVDIDPVQKVATVLVSSDNLYSPVDIGDSIIKGVESIVGYDIEVFVDRETSIRSIFEREIPEIENGSIKVKAVALYPDIVLRILLTSTNIPNPIFVCSNYLADIRKNYNVAEKIYLSQESNDVKDTILSSLYPIQKNEIVEIKLYQEKNQNKADVFVKDESVFRKLLGPEGAYVQTASRITNHWIKAYLDDER